MRTLRTAMVLLLAAGLPAGCGGGGHTPPRALTDSEQAVVAASNGFGFDLFREVSAQAAGRDVFISPLSVSLALGMTLNGAAGQTREEMLEVLDLAGLDEEQANQAYRGLIDMLSHMDSKVTLEIANSIWHRDDFQVEDAFLAANRRSFDAEVAGLDFDDPGAADVINDWVSDATRGRIDSIVDGIPAAVVMYLINAVYFYGDWTRAFKERQTADETFYAPDGELTVPMMHLREEGLDYMSNDRVQAIRLPYGREYFHMTVVLPAPDQDLDALIAELDTATWNEWQAAFTHQEGHLALPRFSLSYETTLNAVLQALGMQAAFDPSLADLSRINPFAELFISEVRHKSFVRVDERGTEAAAVTSVGVSATSVPQTFDMRVDRPFLFVIHDLHSGALLFMGQIHRPAGA